MVCFLIAGGCWSAGGLPGWWLPVPLAVAALAVPLCAVDLTRRRLPDVLTYPAYLVIPATLAVAAA